MKKLILLFLLLNICMTGESQSTNITAQKGNNSLRVVDIKKIFPVKGIDSTDVAEKDWSIGTGGLFADQGFGVVSDTLGDIYVTGRFSKWIVFGTDTLREAMNIGWGRQNMFLVKLNKSGSVLWSKIGLDKGSSDTGGYGVTIDKENNVVVYGQFQNNFTFADTTILATLNNSGKSFIAKLKPTGERIWVKGLGSVERPDQGTYTKTLHATVDNENKIIITGMCWDYGTSFDNFFFKNCSPARNILFILKLDETGKIEWAKGATNMSQSAPTGITTDQNNNIYISTNNLGKSTFFYNDTTPQTIIDRCALLKLTPTGDVDWSISGDGGKSITSDNTGNIYAVGNWESSSKELNLDAGNPNSILKINNTGKIEWQKAYTGFPLFLKTDIHGDLYYMAEVMYSSGFKIDNDSIVVGDRFLCKMNSHSEVIYLKTTGKDGDYRDMTVDINQNVLFTGGYTNVILSDSVYKYALYYDPIINDSIYRSELIGNEMSSRDGYVDLFIAKYCNDILVDKPVDTGLSLPLFVTPNPAKNNILIQLPDFKKQKVVSLDIYNITGKKVKSFELQNRTSTVIEVDCNDMPPGIYIATVHTNRSIFIGKIIIKRN
ncbi:MAG: T9SS type A sorting domain-containing protein [Bacteroidota bacterium]|nr:T9SS type A sorting domain-containing protein [Bacteroidota bacterium]